jgi:hypothetical protein
MSDQQHLRDLQGTKVHRET